MGIDTLELRYTVNKYEAKYIVKQLCLFSPKRKKRLLEFINNSKEHLGSPIIGQEISGLTAGIQAITMYRNKYNQELFYLCITINLSALLTNEKTINLFTPTQRNVYTLQLNYGIAISYLFPKCFNCCLKYHRGQPLRFGLACVPYLALGSIKVIAFTTNLLVTQCKYQTLYMLSHSILAYRQEHKNYSNNNIYLKNRSCRDTIYDKELKCLDKSYCSVKYYMESRNILRYEHTQCSDISRLARSNFNYSEEMPKNIFNCLNALAFFNRKNIEQYIIKRYSTTFRHSDWYTLDLIIKAIRKSSLQGNVKSRMIAIATKCSDESISLNSLLQEAKNMGKDVLHNFNADIRRFEKLSIQPVPIPTKFSIPHIHNPINKIKKSKTRPKVIKPKLPKAILKRFILNLKIINKLNLKQKHIPLNMWKQICIKYLTITFIAFYYSLVNLYRYPKAKVAKTWYYIAPTLEPQSPNIRSPTKFSLTRFIL